MSRRRKSRDQEQVQPERAVPSSKGPSEATSASRRGHARNGQNASNGGTSTQAIATSTTQRHPSQSSMTMTTEDEPLYLGSRKIASLAKGKQRDLGQRHHIGHSGTEGHAGRGDTPQAMVQSDSGSSQGSTLPAWRVPGYVPEHSQPSMPPAGSVTSQYPAPTQNGTAQAGGSRQQRAQTNGHATRQDHHHHARRSNHASPAEASHQQDAEMLTVLIYDHRYSDHGIAEIFVPTFRADSALWVDARDVVDQLQLSPGKVDGPAKVYVMRGGWKQYFLRVEADGRTLSGLANLKVEENSVLKINVDYIPQYAPHLNQYLPPPEQGPPAQRAEQGWSTNSGTTRMQAQPVSVDGHYHQQLHAQSQPRASAGRKRRHRSSGEPFAGTHETGIWGDISDASHIEHPPSSGGSPAPPSMAAHALDARARDTSRLLTSHTSVAPQIEQGSTADDASSESPHPASTPHSSTSMLHSARDVFGAEPEPRAPPQTRPESGSPIEVRSPMLTDQAFSPAAPSIQFSPSPAPPRAPSSLQSTPDSSPPRPQAKRPRYDHDDSDSDLDVDAPRAGQPQRPTITTAPAPASGFGRFASGGTTSSFGQRAAGFGVPSTSLLTSSAVRTVGPAPVAAADGVTPHLQTLLRKEPAYDAFLKARNAANLGISEQVAHWQYLKRTLDLYVGRPVPGDVREAAGTAITKEQVVRAFYVVPVTRADEYEEALALTGLYGPGGTREEDARVVQMYHEPCPVTSNVQLGRYLALLRLVHTRWESQHGSA